MSETLDGRFAAAAARRPDAPALELPGSLEQRDHTVDHGTVDHGTVDFRTIDYRTIDYRTLDAAVDDAVIWLRAHGVSPGDRVAFALPKGLAFVVCHLACLRLRAVSVPVNPRSSAREVAHIVSDAQPALLVSCPELQELAQSSGAGATVCIDPEQGPTAAAGVDDSCTGDGAGDRTGDDTNESRAVINARDGDANEGGGADDASDEDLACLLYTSGTTGRPKGVMLSHGALAANDAALRQAWEWTSTDRLLHVLPLFHVHGLFVALHGALGSGACCRLAPQFAGADTWQQLHEARASVFMGVPTMYHRLLASAPKTLPDLGTMRLFTCGSAPLRSDTLKDFETLTGQRILERYGMTEVGMACSNPYRDERRAGTVGFDLPGVTTRLAGVSDALRAADVHDGEVGEVMIRSASLFSGYWDSAAAAAGAPQPQAELLNGWLASGDLGRRDTDGYLHLVGRAKELIISGGFNVYPQEIEACLNELPGVAEAAVFGIADDDLGELVMAAIVPGHGTPPEPAAALAHCREQLAHYKCPRQIVLLDELPRNAMGKLRRGELAEACGLGS